MSDKKQLRAHYKQLRRDFLPEDRLSCDRSVSERFLESSFYKNCDELLIYVSFDIEVDTIGYADSPLAEYAVIVRKGDNSV